MGELFTLRPNEPLAEVWEYQTDVIVADDGTEQRICLTPLPRREVGGTYVFDDLATLNRHLMAIARGKGAGFSVPFYQYATPLTAAAALGAGTLYVDSRKTQLASTDFAILIDEDETRYEVVQVNVVSAGNVTILTPTAQAWPAGSLLAPVHIAYASGGAVISRANPDEVGSMNMRMREVAFHSPFINPLNVTALPLLNGFPLLTRTPVGTRFGDQVVTGAEVIDHGGTITINSPWKRVKHILERTFRCERLRDIADWEWWFKLADAIKGSQKPFWFPSWRQDFTVVAPPAPGGAAVTLEGHFFRDYCWPHLGLRGLFIETDGGTHYAVATACVNSGANDAVTFAPALPAGGAYALNQKIGLLYKARLGDDKFAWRHLNGISYVSLSIITTDD